MTHQKKGDNPWRAAALMGVMGFEVAICTIIGYWIGSFAGNRLGHSEAWVAGGVIGGLAVGIVSVVLLLKKVLGETNE